MSKKVLADTTFHNGVKYFIVEQPKFVHWKFSAPEKIYTRVDSSSGVIYERSSSSSIEVKVDSLFCNSGSLKVTGNREFYHVYPEEKNVLGEIRKTRRLTSPTVSQGLDVLIYYALNVGIYLEGVSYNWVGSEGNSYTLVYAKINGKEYGTYVSVKDGETIPTRFSLSQNYPNPFNPETTIQYSVPVETRRGESLQKVTLKVYDVLGREVATLVDEYKQPGNYTVSFNARHLERSREIPSGIYFCRLSANNYTKTIKLSLVK
ncbi:MAG: T9SS type A sorting domain-containing protein [Ignavibacteriales bacterium]|nr:T9SS type A sorting domain-containing protein [Ignavibacteriales bacterium]